MADISTEILPLTSIKANPNNPRLVKDDKFKKLVKSIQDFPQMLKIRPIVVNDDMIVLGGNMRLKACKEAGLKEIPVIKASTLTEQQQKEFIIKDNVGYGEWDWEMIANEWDQEELTEWGLDIPDFAVKQEAEEDNYEIPDEIKTDIVTGDLFEIGPHRLLCGDSTNADDVARLMNGQKIDIVFTSPPYNSGDVAMRGGGNFSFAKKGSKTLYKHQSDDKSPEEYFQFCISILNNISLFISNVHVICWNVSYNANSRDGYGKIVFSELNPFTVKETIIWDKTNAIPITSEGIFSRNSELIFIMSSGDKYLTNQKIGKASVYWNTWRIQSSGSQKSEHKACYPVGLPAKAMVDLSQDGHLVYDPFLGSGTTMVASHQLNRKCYGMEIDPKYCQVIVDRMLKLDPTVEVKRNGQPYFSGVNQAK